MRLIGVDPPPSLRGWYINEVFRAKRKNKESLWVVQIREGGTRTAYLVELDSDGSHLRTILDERMHWRVR